MPSAGGAPAGYGAENYAADIAAFRLFARTAAPAMAVVGPGSVGEGGVMASVMPLLSTEKMLAASPRPVFDIYSYHSYAAASIRCSSLGPSAQTTADAALSEQWLARPDSIYAYYVGLRDRFEPGKAVWITETADAACGGILGRQRSWIASDTLTNLVGLRAAGLPSFFTTRSHRASTACSSSNPSSQDPTIGRLSCGAD